MIGEMFTELCSTFNLVNRGMLLIHKRVHKITLASPARMTKNHIATSRKWPESFNHERDNRGAEYSFHSDHHLFIEAVRFKVTAGIKSKEKIQKKAERRFNLLNVYRIAKCICRNRTLADKPLTKGKTNFPKSSGTRPSSTWRLINEAEM